jgi:hypothetical protein
VGVGVASLHVLFEQMIKMADHPIAKSEAVLAE